MNDAVRGYKDIPLLYIAGPFSGQGKDTIDLASKVSLEAFEKGWSVISPHKNCLGFNPDTKNMTYNKWMVALAAQIARCDAVLLLPNWETSKGTCMEVEFCKELEIKIFEFSKEGIPEVFR
jgi:nucleoside 2-deoxyribosyltransferase